MATVVEFYKPWWSDREAPRPRVYENRNAAIKVASKYASELAVDKLGSFEARHLNDYKDIDFVLVYEDDFGNHREEVALLFDAEEVK